MLARFMLFAATFVSGSALAAERPQATPHPAAQAQPTPAPVVLASVDEVRAPAPDAQKAPIAPKPHRIVRVTTCRCGDVAAQPEDQQ